MENSTWIPFYHELAQKILHYIDKQKELIDFIDSLKENKALPVTSLGDLDKNDLSLRIEGIDPFTFIGVLNRGISDENRHKLAVEYKEKFKIKAELPTNFDGIPTIQNLHSWFFSFKKTRKEKDIPMLWDLAKQAINYPENISEDLFNGCLKIKGVGVAYLTMGLFWINPDHFAACDSIIAGYLKKKGFKYSNIKNYTEYLNYIGKLRNFFPDKSFQELSYEAWKEKGSTESLPTTQRYWLYAPGENAEFWEEFYQEGIMALGWDELEDLTHYPDKKAIVKKLQEFHGTNDSMKNNATANDEFLNTMAIGDIVFVKKGRTQLLGYGIVSSDYYYDSARLKFKHCRKVTWESKGEWFCDHSLALKTLTDITKYKSDHPDYTFYYERLQAIIEGTYQSIQPTSDKIMHSLNQILFGPPGTGKTYNSINRALAIVEGKGIKVIEKESEENREEVLRRFQSYVASGQVVFSTFHQSMCYEDFIEGIKPVEVDGQLQYDIQPGVFSLLVEAAMANFKNAKQQTGKRLFEDVWREFLSPLNEEETIPVIMKKSSYKIVHENGRTIFFDKNSGDSKHTLSVNTLKSMYDAGENQIIKGGLQPYYEALLEKLLALGKSSGKVEQKNYVFIIDEINRGNVAQIFGELITLIEPDKRFGNKESLKVTLPYSKKKDFSIPSNLYIVGTMNTADRSVEALDTALRRRFTFIEMPPRYNFPKLENEIIDGITLKMVLEQMNLRIEKLLDKDHLIGHSYFLSVDNIDGLKDKFHQNIIPLLQEYFYGDYAKIGLVLGEAFFETNEKLKKSIFAKFSHDAIDELNEKPVYRLRENWNEGEFEKALKEMVNP